MAHARALARRRLVDEGLEHRRDEVQGGHARGADHLGEVLGVVVAAGTRQHQTRAGQERPEHLPHRHVEAERRLLQHRVVGADAVAVLHPQQAVGDRAVLVHRPFRLAGRAGGVDDVGEAALRLLTVVEIAVVVVGDLRPVRVEGDDLRLPRRELRDQVLLRQEHRHPGVGQHEREPLAGIGGVERDVGAAGLENAEERDHHLEAPLDADADQPVGPDAALEQMARQPVRPAVELGVGQVPVVELDRRRERRSRRLRLEQPVHQPGPAVVGARVVELLDHHPPLAGVEQRQRADRGRRRLGHRREQGLEVIDPAVDRGALEQVAGVVQGAGDRAAALLERQREVEASGVETARDVLAGRPQHRTVLDGDVPLRRVLQREQGLEQRAVAQAPLRPQRFDHLGERQVLVGVGGERRVPHPPEDLGDARVVVEPRAEREGVDEQADQRLELGARPVGHRHADDHVVLAAEPRQQDRPAGEERHEQRRAVGAPEPLSSAASSGERVSGTLAPV